MATKKKCNITTISYTLFFEINWTFKNCLKRTHTANSIQFPSYISFKGMPVVHNIHVTWVFDLIWFVITISLFFNFGLLSLVVKISMSNNWRCLSGKVCTAKRLKIMLLGICLLKISIFFFFWLRSSGIISLSTASLNWKIT